MTPTEPPIESKPAIPPDRRSGITPGDRLIVGVWIAVALVIGRALLQAAVDATADGEGGALLAEHLLEHVVDATSRAWLIVPPLALLPCGRGRLLGALRSFVAFALSFALLAGWPVGELRYRPGLDSARGFQGWAAIVLAAAATAWFDRFATSPLHPIARWSPAMRSLLTAGLLLLGGGGLGTVAHLVDQHRTHMEVEAIEVDLLDVLPVARTTADAEGRRPEVGSILAEKGDGLAGGNKPSLIFPVGSSIEFDADLLPFTSLSFSFGLDRGTLPPRDASGSTLTFSVAVDGKTVLAEKLAPADRPGDRRWLDRRIALTSREARRATIALELRGEGEGICRVRAGFGRPLLVRRQWRPRAAADRGRWNVVLVVVDSLRPDHLGCYGYGRPTSPEIDRLAQSSIVYEQAFASSSWTWPSLASLLTGLWPPTHGVEDLDRCFLSDSIETIAEHFAQEGCTTLGVTANPIVSRTRNFQQGFEEWREFPLAPAARLDEQFRDWVRRYAGYQFFAYVHYVDPHRPYNPPERFAARFASAEDATAMRRAVNELREQRAARADPSFAIGPVVSEEEVMPNLSQEAIVGLYDGEIRCVDQAIGDMQRALEDEQLLDRTIFVVTSTHGEILTAGRPPPAGASLAPELLHVPLIVRDPRQPGRRVPGFIDLTILAPTLIAAAGDRVAANEGGVDGDEERSAALPPWGSSRSRVAFSHTARGLLPGRDEPCELLGFSSEKCRLTMRLDGEVVDFSDLRPDAARGGDAVARREAVVRKLTRWYEACRRSAVSRRFDRKDFWTEVSLREFEEY